MNGNAASIIKVFFAIVSCASFAIKRANVLIPIKWFTGGLNVNNKHESVSRFFPPIIRKVKQFVA